MILFFLACTLEATIPDLTNADTAETADPQVPVASTAFDGDCVQVGANVIALPAPPVAVLLYECAEGECMPMDHVIRGASLAFTCSDPSWSFRAIPILQ